MEFEAKKQAILDEEGSVVGFEFFLLRYGDTYVSEEFITNKIAFVTLRTLAEYGVKKVSEGKRAFVKIPIDSLLTHTFELIDPHLMVYKLIPPGVGAGKTVYTKALSVVEELRRRGGMVSVHHDLVKDHPDIVKYADMIEFEAKRANGEEMVRIQNLGKRILVSGVDRKRDYDRLVGLADYLQGEAVKPSIHIDRFKIAPFLKSTLLRLLVLMNTAQSPTEFAKVIETDVGMSAKLLRFLNSAYFSLRKRISSIEQATVYFGLKNLKNFIIVLSMNDYAAVQNPMLWRRSLIRAKLMEELSKNVLPDLSSEAYLVGLFSLIDNILDVDIPQFLEEVNVDERVISAFRDENSPLAKLLRIATLLEEKEEQLRSMKEPQKATFLKELSKELKLTEEELLNILRSSYVMADTIIHL